MCQRLVDKVAQSRQLMAMTDPDLLVLFEDWFEELEEEIISLVDSMALSTRQNLPKGWAILTGGNISSLEAQA